MRRRRDFLRVRELGRRLQTAHFAVYLARLPDQATPRLGMAVSRHTGNAVVRNRIKRRLRESFRTQLREVLLPQCVLVVIARKDSGLLTTPALIAELRPAIQRLVKRFEN